MMMSLSPSVPPLPLVDKDDPQAIKTIFVSIASYRDKICPTTLESLYSNAKIPQRVFVGIVQQNKKGDVDCLPSSSPPFLPLSGEPRSCSLDEWIHTNVRIHRLSHEEAKGPTYARYLCAQMCEAHHDYFFQIDSHSLFVEEWDERLLDMILTCPLPARSILSHYPPNYHDYERRHESFFREHVTYVPGVFLNHDQILSFQGAHYVQTKGKCLPSPFVSANMLFAPRIFLEEVPFDPFLPHLFTGEEILLSVRAFTHGYQVYTCSSNILFHFYTRKDDAKFWDDLADEYRRQNGHSVQKVKQIMQYPDVQPLNHSPYGLGTVRSIHDFYEWIGMDRKKMKVENPSIVVLIERGTQLYDPQTSTEKNRISTSSTSAYHPWYSRRGSWALILMIFLVVILAVGCTLLFSSVGRGRKSEWHVGPQSRKP